MDWSILPEVMLRAILVALGRSTDGDKPDLVPLMLSMRKHRGFLTFDVPISSDRVYSSYSALAQVRRVEAVVNRAVEGPTRGGGGIVEDKSVSPPPNKYPPVGGVLAFDVG